MVVFKILGPLEIHTPHRVLRPKRGLQSSLLVALLAEPRQLVLTDSLVEELWGEKPPAHVENALQAHVSRLRRKLDAIDPQYGGRRLETCSIGYALDVTDDELDAAQFAARLDLLRATAEPSAAAAVDQLRSILALYRGPALGGEARGQLSRAAIARHEELRLYALEMLFDSELRSGNHAAIIPELYDAVSAYPSKERLWQQLILALYRSERQADALRVYRRLRHRLTEELGLQPSPTMRRYERAILNRDPALDLRTPDPPGSARPAREMLASAGTPALPVR